MTPESRPMTVRLHIDRVVLDPGMIGAGYHDRLADALQAELATLLGASGGADFLLADAGEHRISPRTVAPDGADATALGRQIAGATHAAIVRDARSGTAPLGRSGTTPLGRSGTNLLGRDSR